MFDQLVEFCKAGVVGSEGGGIKEEFAKVGARVEGSEGGLDFGEDGLDGRPVGFPGEVEGDHVLSAGGAEEEVVGGDVAQFGDKEDFVQFVGEWEEGLEGPWSVGGVDKEFGLEFFAGTGREFEPEVGQTVVPGARQADLSGAVDGIDAFERVEVVVDAGLVEEGFGGLRVLVEAGFDPDLVERRF